MRRSFALACLAFAGLWQPAHAGLLGPAAYTQPADSPFAGLPFSYFHLDNFETGAWSVPGVSANTGGPISNSLVDSVDVGCPLSPYCYSWFAGNGSAGVRFTFDLNVLGQLPTHAGLVWTDGFGTIAFEAFDPNGVSLGTATGNHASPSFYPDASDDRFYGAVNAGGIGAIHIWNQAGGIEIDHLQFGALNTEAPEPGTWVLLGTGLAGAALLRRISRRRRGAAA